MSLVSFSDDLGFTFLDVLWQAVSTITAVLFLLSKIVLGNQSEMIFTL